MIALQKAAKRLSGAIRDMNCYCKLHAMCTKVATGKSRGQFETAENRMTILGKNLLLG
jgi:hypothetical protein